MFVGKFYTKIREELSFVHKTRLDSLLTVSGALIDGSKLSVAHLGNRIRNNTTPKHNIKKVDRLLGNKNLEIKEIYSKLSQMLLSCMKEAIILVDWCVYENKKYHVLQASLVAEGRSLPVYRDAYDITSANFHQTTAESDFLDNLERCIPKNIHKVVIVTDAGFHTPWFYKIISLGWHFVGRLRGNLTIKLDNNDSWKTANEFFNQGSNRPKFLGEVKVGKSVFSKYGITAGAHTYHSRRKNRESINKRYCKAINELYKAANKEPWVLLTSLRELDQCSKSVIKIYQKRMQVEQNFRDDKNNRWGFAFRSTKCGKAHRLSVYLLLDTIAQIFLWLIGFAAESSGLKQKFQVNTIKRRVLSYISLGKLIVMQNVEIKSNFIKAGLLYIASMNSEVFP